MITRACISINNNCNMNCRYCHFHEKKGSIIESDMDVFEILDNIRKYITKNSIQLFKIGFVGNGEPLLEYDKLRSYIEYIKDLLDIGTISAYTITNGILINQDKLEFFKKHKINVGFSIDGIKSVHDKLRCNSFDKVIDAVELYKKIWGCYPPMNCTVGRDVLIHAEDTISFFEQFDTKITFSRMIGNYGISLAEYHSFIDQASKKLNVRKGNYDCTMYGGLCGAGINNPFYSNGKIFLCGNCVDVDTSYPYNTELDDINFSLPEFDRTKCYKDCVLKK